jgi:tetratricopeptide (TPR) repeat protein
MFRRLRPAIILVALACSAPPGAPPLDSRRAQPDPPAAPFPVAPPSRPVPAPSCPSGQAVRPDRLATRAGEVLAPGDAPAALACAEEALAKDPRNLSALRRRAAALAALGRVEEAREAWARAVAVDPDDPETLLGAADLHVARLGGDRAALKAGRAQALRGARLATRPPRRDPGLAARLLLVAAMAENDLGDSLAALRHVETALRLRPGDADAVYERGVALYELCRFPESRRAFETVLRKVPDDAWALHYLGLLAERAGEDGRAERLLARANRLAPSDLRPPVEVGREAFEDEVRRAVRALPEGERRALDGVPVKVEDLPGLADLTAVDPPLSPSILGLFRGPPEGEECGPDEPRDCRAIVFYRKNLSRFARDRAELAEQVRVTLLHELGHLHGESDEALRERGLE